MYKFGIASEQRLKKAHPDLQLIYRTYLKHTRIDIGIAESHRSVELQFKYFKKGLSKIDGKKRLGKHNYLPALAIDFYPFVNGKACYDLETVSHVAGGLIMVSELLYEQGLVTHKLRWGGNWDRDGIILIDQSFDDRPHTELIKA